MTDTPQIGSNSAIEVDPDSLLGYLDELENKKQAITESSGVLRARIKEILTDTGWNKSALATIRQIAAMSETSRADYLRTFEPLFDAMMQTVWTSEMADLLDQLEAEGAE